MTRTTLNRDLALILDSYRLGSNLAGVSTIPIAYAAFPWMGFSAT